MARGASPTTLDRWVRLTSRSALCDLGGYRTRVGATTVWHACYIGGSLHDLEPRGRARLDGLGIRTVVELVAQHTPGAGTRAEGTPIPTQGDHHLIAVAATPPLGHADTAPGLSPRGPHEVGAGWRDALEEAAAGWRDALELAATVALPVTFTSGAGTATAALLSAVLLGALGVADEEIIRHASLAAPTVDLLAAQADLQLAEHGVPPLAAERTSTAGGGVAEILRLANDEHGSMLGWALDHGVDPAVVASLRDRLLA